MAFSFEWDARKAAENLANHGVSFGEAITVFGDPLGRIVPDRRHSIGEPRFVLLGETPTGRLLAVMFTDRGEDRVRVISARRATRHERSEYEESQG
jgi:uncharacterized DUF497 family protein